MEEVYREDIVATGVTTTDGRGGICDAQLYQLAGFEASVVKF